MLLERFIKRTKYGEDLSWKNDAEKKALRKSYEVDYRSVMENLQEAFDKELMVADENEAIVRDFMEDPFLSDFYYLD